MKNRALLAFLGGAAAGLIAGLLLAPREGKETREKISRFFDDEKDKINDIVDSVRDGYEGVVETVKSRPAKTTTKTTAKAPRAKTK